MPRQPRPPPEVPGPACAPVCLGPAGCLDLSQPSLPPFLAGVGGGVERENSGVPCDGASSNACSLLKSLQQLPSHLQTLLDPVSPCLPGVITCHLLRTSVQPPSWSSTLQSYSHLRAFALAVLSAQKALCPNLNQAHAITPFYPLLKCCLLSKDLTDYLPLYPHVSYPYPLLYFPPYIPYLIPNLVYFFSCTVLLSGAGSL